MSYPRQSILFISGLDKSVNENQLYQLFNEFPISYIKIAKDHKTRESYGYAFVGFKNHSKAEEALIKLNYSKVAKKTIRISWYNREPNNYRAHPEFNIFVKKLNKNVTGKEFHDYFSKFGNIISAKLVEDDDGEVVGYGFVLFDNEESASKAIKEANGIDWKGKPIYVGRFEKNRPKKSPQFNTVYVKNLPKNYSQEDVKKIFSAYGEILSIFMKSTDPNLVEKLPEEKRKSILEHQFAFITFKDFSAAGRVVNEFPYLKPGDNAYNQDITSIADITVKSGLFDNTNAFKFACYLIENVGNYREVARSAPLLKEHAGQFAKHLAENDNVYVIRDKAGHLECCQALKKKDRIKKLKALYEKIKAQIREKYKFCNLYVKNLPDNFDDEGLRQLFEKYGRIRSYKTVKRDLVQSYLGVKRSVKVFGFVCFYESEHARNAKKDLHEREIANKCKLFVDYHQSKREREEILKLKMLNQSQKIMQKQLSPTNLQDLPFPGMIRNLGNMQGNLYAPQMLRKFPSNSGFPRTPQMPPNMMFNNHFSPQGFPMGGGMSPSGGMNSIPQMNNTMNNNLGDMQQINMMDKGTKTEFFGERLYNKISSNTNFTKFQGYFSKVVGIFLDLEDDVIIKLLSDDHYFNTQTAETIKQLLDKVSPK